MNWQLLFKHHVIWNNDIGDIVKPEIPDGINMQYIEMLSEYNQLCVCLYSKSSFLIEQLQHKIDAYSGHLHHIDKHALAATLRTINTSGEVTIHIDSINSFMYLLQQDFSNTIKKRKTDTQEQQFKKQKHF